MSEKNQRIKTGLQSIRQLFSLEPNQSPLFFHGILCFFWRLADFAPGYLGYHMRWLVGRLRFKKLGKWARIRSHNTFYDGREIEIGDYFTSGKFNYFSGGPIRVGSHVSLANFVIIETVDHHFDDLTIPIRKQGIVFNPVVIEDDVLISNRVTILGGVTIGQGSVIGAGAVVTRDIPPNSIAVGNPARVVRQRGYQRNGSAIKSHADGTASPSDAEVGNQ